MWSIWSWLMGCSGPCGEPGPHAFYARAELVDEPGRALDAELVHDERQDPAEQRRRRRESPAPPLRREVLLAVPGSRRPAAGARGASSVARATGTTMTSSFFDDAQRRDGIAAKITSRRHAQAAVWRTKGVTDWSATESIEGPAAMPVA